MRHYFSASVAAIAVVACSTAALAQEVTSSIRGVVTANGAPVSGAKVTVTHVPSGTTNTATTGADGTFATSGLRIGGPFTVKVSASGYSVSSVTDIDLTAGQPLRLPIELATTGNEIVVTAAKSKAIELSPGPITSISREKIANMATVNRDIRDIVRRDPFATIDPGQSRGVMIAGQNARLNKFSVDGLGFTDNFGLNVGGLPTTRGPVPIDAIEQLSVKVAPFDISEGNFQGGAINIILRSGGNKFHGSGFYTYFGDSLRGDQAKGLAKQTTKFSSKNWGGFLSGPIIKDKLFFAFSYERLEESNPPLFGINGVGNTVPNISQAQIDALAATAKSVYNYDTGGLFLGGPETDEKYTAKVDWNITDGQRFAFTYIHNKGNTANDPGFSNVGPSAPTLSLMSNDFSRPEIVDSFVGQLNSDWSDNFHTELRGNYRNYDLEPAPYGKFPFSEMQVCLDQSGTVAENGGANSSNSFTCTPGATGSPGSGILYFGPDHFRHFNSVKTKQYGTDAAIRWEYRKFSMKLTAAWSHLDVANAFTPNALGTYTFDSLADFQAQRASSLSLAGAITGNLTDVLASFKYDQFTFGAQTSWDPDPTFSATAGARVDLFSLHDKPPLNQFFAQRYGFANTGTINGKYVFQPRFSATWTPLTRLKLRGGLGLFAGGSPDVFQGNSYSVANVFGNSITIRRNADGTCAAPTTTICNAALTGVTGTGFNQAVLDYLRTNTASLSVATVNALDPHYKMESTWKASLSADYKADFDNFLGHGWSFGSDFYYGWVKNAPIYYDLRLIAKGVAPDGRTIYQQTPLAIANSNNDLLLTNTKLGHSLVAVARFEKSWDWGLSIGGSYTYQNVKDVSSMNGTTGAGTYGQNPMVDPNKAAYGTSIYQVKDSFKFHFDFEHEFAKDFKTSFSLFGERRSGIPYSLTMLDTVGSNGHGIVFGAQESSGPTQSRYLLYVPNVSSMTADSKVTYDSLATFTAFSNFVTASGLKQGAIISKNSQTSPHWFKLDLHVDQEVPLPIVNRYAAGAHVKVFADFENFLNMLNKDWGSLRQVSFPYLSPVVTVSCAQASGTNCTQYQYSKFSNPALVTQTKISLWSIRIGAKVEF